MTDDRPWTCGWMAGAFVVVLALLIVSCAGCSASRPAETVIPTSSPPSSGLSRNLSLPTGAPIGPPPSGSHLPTVAAVGEPAQRTAIPSAARNLSTAATSGPGKWYDDGLGLYGATGWWHWGMAPVTARVCGDHGCAVVTIRDHMVSTTTLIDLGPDAFRVVCGPLSRGVCTVTVER